MGGAPSRRTFSSLLWCCAREGRRAAHWPRLHRRLRTTPLLRTFSFHACARAWHCGTLGRRAGGERAGEASEPCPPSSPPPPSLPPHTHMPLLVTCPLATCSPRPSFSSPLLSSVITAESCGPERLSVRRWGHLAAVCTCLTARCGSGEGGWAAVSENGQSRPSRDML